MQVSQIWGQIFEDELSRVIRVGHHKEAIDAALMEGDSMPGMANHREQVCDDGFVPAP